MEGMVDSPVGTARGTPVAHARPDLVGAPVADVSIRRRRETPAGARRVESLHEAWGQDVVRVFLKSY